jgi:hypothetical protein
MDRQDKTVSIEMSVNQLNVVLNQLAKAPFEDVADLIVNIRAQAINQLQSESDQQKAESNEVE